MQVVLRDISSDRRGQPCRQVSATEKLHHPLQLICHWRAVAEFMTEHCEMFTHQCTAVSSSDKDVAQAALNVMCRYTAYLRPETVAFSLASDAVSDENKTSMAAV